MSEPAPTGKAPTYTTSSQYGGSAVRSNRAEPSREMPNQFDAAIVILGSCDE
jgi:hypothetical protein